MENNHSLMDVLNDNFYQNYMDQRAVLEKKRILCEEKVLNNSSSANGLFCPVIWDGVICWPSVPAGTFYEIICPSYVHGFNTDAFASKFCTSDGSWWLNEEFNQTWTNYSLCILEKPVDLTITTYNGGFYVPHLTTIKWISKIGYSVSFSTLIVALLILVFLRKLRCPRNNLHMHLFMSFMMRALMFLLKDALFVAGMGLQSNVVLSKDGLPEFRETRNNIDCKVFISFWHYFLMANYFWILMEGLYLHNLIFLAMLTDTSGIFPYVITGWGLPVLFIVPWIIVRALLEDKLCWTTNENPDYFWIIRAPITVSIIVNFVFFINITRVLFLKMFVSLAMQARRYRYRKWFRSTLVLVPLFGVHYAVLLGMSFFIGVNQIVELTWLYIDLLFSSFQGCFVALLYCFSNGEVSSF
ncbi:parathyroid hormone/parathyroid hormone-related peptide receptor-like [Limulus polyphemus]|uniref:Parathyroid hormone/parathyroid hormone-related peptide receptor-like n=1 Tax=Limulus polyphemus TaxID=6850 RepID=A0ABM1SD57_LIMPO|nr:parathyroid hormone/parathyroid hormone-related peptide receptor-like [Limulus polyphemus]